VSLTKDELVFAGFGVVAPEYNWDDYAGTDVKGKVVIVMVNDPGFGTGDTTLFKGKAMTYYGRWTYKFEEASRHGAKGCLIVHNEAAASYPFAVVQNSWSGSQLHLDPRGKSEYRVAVEGWLTEDAAKKLLSASQGDATLLSKAQQKGFKAVPLGLTAATSMNVKSVFNQSKNVIGRITGTKRPGEYIVFTAHWDHFGIGKPDEGGDSIYNGALDNASGTAALLELARAFKNMHTPPERSLIFLAVTGEEQGLLGSEFYAENPIYPLDKTVANINVDGINNIGKARDINIVGVGQSELEDYLAKEVAATGRYISKDQHPEAGHYFRSDHFSFAKVGVPALTTAGGVDNIEHGIAFGKQKDQEYSDKYYHRPGDEYNAQYWNLEGGLDDIKLLFLVGKRLAFETTWPKWKETSEFRKLRNP
jgi:Zn-dependent M28 family amino/carboxypeptidase